MNINISIGEFIDRITILEIKQARIKDPDQLQNVNRELSMLLSQLSQQPWVNSIGDDHIALKDINQRLWDVEDAIRLKERDQTFDQAFIDLARSVYHLNDERARIKRRINLSHGSELVEEKSYA